MTSKWVRVGKKIGWLAGILALADTASRGAEFTLAAADRDFLDDVEQRAVRFFAEQTDRETGLTCDRAPANGDASTAPASIAATGFALTARCIADIRGWSAPGEARREVLKTLDYVATRYPQEHGWFYHYVDAATGVRAWNCEASTIDTALFLQGALVAREYFQDPAITARVTEIYARIDWQWALNGGPTLTHGWKPEGGFLPYRWDSYAELMGMYLLGLGAPRQALPPAAWQAWRRPVVECEGRRFIQCAPLFTHQYAQAWFDFRSRRDGYADYWQNSVAATLAQRDWSAAQASRFPHWSAELWGLTASDGPHGYMGWGTAAAETDGTLVPCAPGGSLPFAPEECLAALRRMRELKLPGLWSRYGFADAFNPETGWVSPDVIGIDAGITLLMSENLRTHFVWEYFMRAPEVQAGMARADFQRTESPAPVVVVASGPTAGGKG